MQLIVATDIFGAQPELLWQLDKLNTAYLCVQPYDHQPAVFTSDQQAYDYFQLQGGMAAYSLKLEAVLKAQSEPVFLLGFSAGAAACWANLAQPQLNIVHCMGFYAGQVRQMTQLQPLYSTELIFAEETHFVVAELMHALADKANLRQSVEPYPHGFMNPLSQGYRAEVADRYWQSIRAQALSFVS